MLTHQSQLRSWSVGGEGEGTVFAQSWKERATGSPIAISSCLLGGDTDCPQRCTERKRSTDQSCNMGCYSFIWKRKLFIFREVKHWNRSLESLLDFHPWRCSKVPCAWPWATWSDGIQVGQQDEPGDLCKTPPVHTILWSHLATLFQGAENQVFLCLTLSSAADDPDMVDRVINKYMFKFITIYIHFFLFLHAWKSVIFASQHALGISSALLLFASLSDLLVSSTQNRTWEKSRKHKEENKNHVEKEKHHLFHFNSRHL